MKITIKEEKTRPNQPLRLEDIEPGSIIEFDIDHSPIGLVISKVGGGREIVLLCHKFDNDDDNAWFQLAAGWKKYPIRKVLGKLTEIVVEPV